MPLQRANHQLQPKKKVKRADSQVRSLLACFIEERARPNDGYAVMAVERPCRQALTGGHIQTIPDACLTTPTALCIIIHQTFSCLSTARHFSYQQASCTLVQHLNTHYCITSQDGTIENPYRKGAPDTGRLQTAYSLFEVLRPFEVRPLSLHLLQLCRS